MQNHDPLHGVVVACIYFMVKDRKGTYNQVACNISRLKDEFLLKFGDKAR